MSIQSSRLVDLSVTLGDSPSEAVPVSVEYMPDSLGGGHLAELVGLETSSLLGGLGWASERVSSITHSGTHVDAPYHYSPYCGGCPSHTIDEMPLDWFFGPGVKIAVDPTKDGRILPTELAEFERDANYQVKSGDIVLFHTGAENSYGTASYNQCGRGLDPALVELLCDRGVRVFGTDAWSIDPPFQRMRCEAERQGPDSVWSAHFVGREREFCAIEKLCNLSELPTRNFWVVCFPVKVCRGSAGWTRAVALVNHNA